MSVLIGSKGILEFGYVINGKTIFRQKEHVIFVAS